MLVIRIMLDVLEKVPTVSSTSNSSTVLVTRSV
jgi:hypothetical protein